MWSLRSIAAETSISMHKNTIQQRRNLTSGFLSVLDQCFSAADLGSNSQLWDIWNSLWNSCKEGWLVFWAGGERRELLSCFYVFNKQFLHAGKINTKKNKSNNWAIKLQPNFIATVTFYGLTAEYNPQIVFKEVRCLFGLKKVERHPLDDR